MGLHQRLLIAFCLLSAINKAQLECFETSSSPVNISFIQNAVEKGAVCLDGSPGAYYFDRGHGSGATSWLVYLRGGGWCENEIACLDKSKNDKGSTKYAKSMSSFKSITSPNQTQNPDFYNWNRVDVLYCDGASFMADVEVVDPETKLYLRGRRIFGAIMEELIATKGMNFATNGVLVGNSAGGLATILNCDRFHSYLPFARRVKCFSDSGFFIHAPEIPGAINRVNYFANLTTFHKLDDFLPESCTSRLAPSLCMFPENVVDDIQTPLFLLNSVYDRYQINNNVIPNPVDNQGWANCTHSFNETKNCTANQFQLIIDFGKAFMRTLEALDDCPSRGLFINSCYIHDFIYRPNNWQGEPALQNKTIARAFGDWYYERSSVQLIDTEHPYPIDCNTTNIP